MSHKTSANSRVSVEIPFHGTTPLSIESGWVAKQANGAVIVRQGETMVLVTVCTGPSRMGQDFFPLTIEYQEKTYAAGRIPGGFFKREGRLSESEILTCRIIDRPIRPLFTDGFLDEVQVIATVLSADGVHSPDMLALCGASAALHISSLPFQGPIAGVRVGRINGQLVINPSRKDFDKSDLEFIVAGTREAIVMVEGGAQMVPESEVLEALYFGHAELQKVIELQEELRRKVGVPKMEFAAPAVDAALHESIKGVVGNRIEDALNIRGKHERRDALSAVTKDVLAALAEKFPERDKEIKDIVHDLVNLAARLQIVKKKVRLDGRGTRDVRPIECQVGVIPRAHGSALFTRGETQAFVTTTLGT